MAKIHSIHAAKTHLSRLIEQAEAGESIVIARGSTPVVKLVPIHRALPQRKFGSLRGRARVDARFFEPMAPDELAR